LLPDLIHYTSQSEYEAHFQKVYCCGPVITFDQIAVRFKKSDFIHCFFESTRRDGRKDLFSKQRSERIDWIKATLEDPGADLRVGWNKSKKNYDQDRRVAIVSGNYVVIISIKKNNTKEARFITAYLADSKSTIDKIKKSPTWK